MASRFYANIFANNEGDYGCFWVTGAPLSLWGEGWSRESDLNRRPDDYKSNVFLFRSVGLKFLMKAWKQAKSRLAEPLQANIEDQEGIPMNSKSGWKVAGKFIGKGDARYWLQAGKLHTDPRGNGSLVCRIQMGGRREPFPLKTTNKTAAAAKAAKIYGDVVALGWEAALAKHKPTVVKVRGSTVGDLIQAVSELANVRPTTLRGYVASFRRVHENSSQGRPLRPLWERSGRLAQGGGCRSIGGSLPGQN